MKLSRLFYFTAKSYLKKPFFVIALFILPVVGILLNSALSGEESEQIRVAFYIEDEDEDTKWLSEALIGSQNSFSFYAAEDEDSLCDDVLTGEAECGYLIPGNIYELLKENDAENSVTVVSGAKSTLISIVNETFYSTLFRRLSRNLLLNYLSRYSDVKDAYGSLFDSRDVYELHDKYMQNAATFRVNYENRPSYHVTDKTSIILSPLKGLFAVLILASGFIGALSYYRAAKHPVFALFRVRLVQILIPMLFTGLVVLLSLYLFPELPDVERGIVGFLKEASALLLYIALCLSFLLLLTTLIRSERLFYAVFPLYLLGCLVFSPVFIDIGQYVPLFKTVSRLFLPTWYL